MLSKFQYYYCVGLLYNDLAAQIPFISPSLSLSTHRGSEYFVVLTSIKIPAPLAALHCALSHRVVWSYGVMSCDKELHSVSQQHTSTDIQKDSLLLALCKHANMFQYNTAIMTNIVHAQDLNEEIHACLHKQTQLLDNTIWLRNQIESVIKYDERKETDLCERNQPLSSPSIRVLRSILPVLTHRPVNRLRPAAQFNATTCYPRVSAYASLALMSSDKPNISGAFTPFGLTWRLTSNYRAHCVALRSVSVLTVHADHFNGLKLMSL